jgi:hypothetical protein
LFSSNTLEFLIPTMAIFHERTSGFKFKAIQFSVKKPGSFSKPGLEAGAGRLKFKPMDVDYFRRVPVIGNDGRNGEKQHPQVPKELV